MAISADMKLILNGETHQAPDGVTVQAFLAALGIPEKGVAVERNLEIVPKSAFGDVRLQDGDKLEIIQFVGGG